MAKISGFLSDAGLTPFEGRWPELKWRLQIPATSGLNVLTREPVAAAITDATGAFTVDVVSTDEMLPTRARYDVTAHWDLREIDVFQNLRIPPGEWSMADLVALSRVPEFGSDLTWIGPDEPDETKRWMWWIDTSTNPPLLKEWE